MINKLLMGVFKLIISLVNVLLTPIDAVISQFMPGLDNALALVNGFIDWAINLIPWGMSWFGLSSTTITLLVAYFTFELTVPLAVHTMKLAVKWYNNLKP